MAEEASRALASADENFAGDAFDNLQKHGRIQCEKIGNNRG